MKIRALKKNSVAISVVIGTILMLVITVAISATTYIYVNGSFDEPNVKLMSMVDMQFNSHTQQLQIRHITGDTFEDALTFKTEGQANQEDWWNGNWHKRIPFTITSLSDLSNYQLKIEISYDSDMQQDFDDIRFIDSDDSSELSFWRQNYETGSKATFWVKIPSIPAGEKTVYLYYNNNGVASSSNPQATFDSFVNFNQDSLVSHDSDEQDVEPNAHSIIDKYTISFFGNSWKGILKNIQISSDGSQLLSFDFRSTGINDSEIAGVGFDTDDQLDPNNDDDQFYQVFGTQDWGIQEEHNYVGSDWQSYTIQLNDFSGNFNRFFINNDADGQNDEGIKDTMIYYRNIRIHQFAPTSPSVSIQNADEETSTVPEPSYELHNLAITINDEPISYESFQLSSGGTDMNGGDILTISFTDDQMPSHGDTVAIRYKPTNQLIKVQMI